MKGYTKDTLLFRSGYGFVTDKNRLLPDTLRRFLRKCVTNL